MQDKREIDLEKIVSNVNKTLIGILATLKCHQWVTVDRGYRAIGGEFLLVPLLLLARYLYKGVKETLREGNNYGKENKSSYSINKVLQGNRKRAK